MFRKTLLVLSALPLLFGVAFSETEELQPEKDAGIFEGAPVGQYGSMDFCWIGYDSGRCDTLIHFPLDDYIGVELYSATLEVYVFYSWGTIPSDNWMARVADDWVETIVCWQYSPGWDDGIVLDFGPPTLDDWLSIDVTTIVESWLDESFDNYGFYMSTYDETGGVWFRSREYSTSTLRPKLTFEYDFTPIQPVSVGKIKTLLK